MVTRKKPIAGKQLAVAALKKLRNIWKQDHNRISKRLDALRRRHFRCILGIRYPNTITNEELYRGCKTRQLDSIIREARWKMLGNIVDEIPAKLARLSRATQNNPASVAHLADANKKSAPERERGENGTHNNNNNNKYI